MSAAIKKFPGPAKDQAPEEDDDDEDECPKCPPVGAPAWLATFADIATNLMAFFVLILGFAKFDEPSFEKMAGSMRERFGTEVISPIIKSPPENSVIEFDFQSGEDKTGKGSREDASETGDDVDERSDSAGGTEQEASEAKARAEGKAAAEALLDALSSGGVKVEQGDHSVTVRLDDAQSQPDAEAIAKALAQAAGTDVTEAPDGADAQNAPASDPSEQPAAGADAESSPGRGGAGGVAKGPSHSPGFAAARLSVALEQEIGKGLVTVERHEGKVFVTLGEGGGFASGSADITEEASALVERITDVALSPDATVTVTGHTDSVPLSGSPYTDNLGLGAARAAAVLREMVASGKVDPSKASATSKGEFDPVADNETAEGRAKNRRIEIEIDYATP